MQPRATLSARESAHAHAQFAFAQSSALVRRHQPTAVTDTRTADTRTGHQPLRIAGARFLRPALLSALATACGIVSAGVPTLAAQSKGEKVKVLAGSALRAAPGGQMVGVSSRAFDAAVEMVLGDAVRLRINGFMESGDVRLESNKARGVAGPTNGRADAGGTVRVGPAEKEPALATLQRGTVVFSTGKSASFLAVNRTVWVDKSRLAKLTAPTASSRSAAPAPRAAATRTSTGATPTSGTPTATARGNTDPSQSPTTPTSPTPARASDGAKLAASAASAPEARMVTRAASALRSGPEGNTLLAVPKGIVLLPTGVENGWTHVRLEGWIPTRDLAAATDKALGELSAADLRADPAGTKGKVVRWTVEALSYQLGDALRRELNGEPYLLARGPGDERAVLYLAVPDSLVAAARALAPLSTISITARVRSGRSEPGGVPILDMLELSRR